MEINEVQEKLENMHFDDIVKSYCNKVNDLEKEKAKTKELQEKVGEQKTKYGELVTLYEENLGQLLDAVKQNKELQAKIDELEKEKQVESDAVDKEQIIKWIAQRIKDEQRKHSSFDENWHEIAARKIYASYDIKLKKDAK